ncbi:hypothetical protein Dimus_008563 [Dionaea muscipula]
MEAFTLLKYWKGGGISGIGCAGSLVPGDTTSAARTANTQTVVTTAGDSDSDDEGGFFEVEFAVPDEDVVELQQDKSENGARDVGINGEVAEMEVLEEVHEAENDEDDDVESVDTDKTSDLNLSLSQSDHELFFKGRLQPLEETTVVVTGTEANSKPQLVVSLFKSATKLGVLMSGLKKPKLQQQQQHSKENQQQEKQISQKLFKVKFKVEEVPIVSLFFTRDSSARSSTAAAKPAQVPEQSATTAAAAAVTSTASSDEKRISKDVMQKYLSKVKPLYIRVSKKYSDKLRLSGPLVALSPGAKPKQPQEKPRKPDESVNSIVKGEREAGEGKEEGLVATGGGGQKLPVNNIGVGLNVMKKKHLGKSKSASSVVHSVPMQNRRRDDSLLQQQDGIQDAILHCKMSLNARSLGVLVEGEKGTSVLLSRSVSDPSYEKSIKAEAKEERNDVVQEDTIGSEQKYE